MQLAYEPFLLGVLSAVAIPLSEGMLVGASTATWTGSPDIREAILKEIVAYHVGVSVYFKNSKSIVFGRAFY